MIFPELRQVKEPVFLLYTVDIHGSRHNLIMATAHRNRLKKACVRAIHNDLIEYCPDSCSDKLQQLRLFRQDFERLALAGVNRNLRYAIITICEDGKEIV